MKFILSQNCLVEGVLVNQLLSRSRDSSKREFPTNVHYIITDNDLPPLNYSEDKIPSCKTHVI
jgi:hypothetical protein